MNQDSYVGPHAVRVEATLLDTIDAYYVTRLARVGYKALTTHISWALRAYYGVSTSPFGRIKMTVPTAGSPFTISWTGPTGFDSSFGRLSTPSQQIPTGIRGHCNTLYPKTYTEVSNNRCSLPEGHSLAALTACRVSIQLCLAYTIPRIHTDCPDPWSVEDSL